MTGKIELLYVNTFLVILLEKIIGNQDQKELSIRLFMYDLFLEKYLIYTEIRVF